MKNWRNSMYLLSLFDIFPSVKTSLGAFVENYSLHDAIMLSFVVNSLDEVFIVFYIDPWWSDDLAAYRIGDVDRWPVVVLRLEGVESIQMQLKNHAMPIGFSGATTVVVGPKVRLSATGTYGDDIVVVASNSVSVICVSSEDIPITLSELEPIGSKVTYLKCSWNHNSADDPILLYSEIDETRYEIRKIEVFRDESMQTAQKGRVDGDTMLGSMPVPEIEEINRDKVFHSEYISKEEFELQWKAAEGRRQVM